MAYTHIHLGLAPNDRVEVHPPQDGGRPSITLGSAFIFLDWDQLEALSDKTLKLLAEKPVKSEAA